MPRPRTEAPGDVRSLSTDDPLPSPLSGEMKKSFLPSLTLLPAEGESGMGRIESRECEGDEVEPRVADDSLDDEGWSDDDEADDRSSTVCKRGRGVFSVGGGGWEIV